MKYTDSEKSSMSVIDQDILNQMAAIRRDLHRYPELGWEETRTAAKVCETLEQIGVAYQTGSAGTGVIAELPGQQDEPYIALRADMDALSVVEETGLPFASKVDGVMHACGCAASIHTGPIDLIH